MPLKYIYKPFKPSKNFDTDINERGKKPFQLSCFNSASLSEGELSHSMGHFFLPISMCVQYN